MQVGDCIEMCADQIVDLEVGGSIPLTRPICFNDLRAFWRFVKRGFMISDHKTSNNRLRTSRNVLIFFAIYLALIWLKLSLFQKWWCSACASIVHGWVPSG